MPKAEITYQCGHRKVDFIFASSERIPHELARYAKMLCCACQLAKEQQQFEEAIARAGEVYNITDQNGCLITATRTTPGRCWITICLEGSEVPCYKRELEISWVTAELYERNHWGLYWSANRFSHPSK